MAASPPVLGSALLAGAWLASPAFVPQVFTRSGSASGQVALRGASAGPTVAQSRESGAGHLVMAPLGVALLGLATVSRHQRSPAVSRRSKKAGTYKDFEDPWLGSADLGFDPLNVAVGSVFNKGTAVVPETTYYNYRESEVKHGRFAMAAFLAIFFEEADRGAVLKQLGVSGAVDNLDGTLGLDEVQAPVLLLGLGAQAFAEYSKQSKENDGSFLTVEYERDRCPGDLGFDPLGVGAGNTRGQLIELHNLEVNLGRLAMIGVTSFLFKEFVVKDASIAAKIL